MRQRAKKFFLFQTTGKQREYWIVDEHSLQLVPKPRELVIQNSLVESVRDYCITQNTKDLTIVDKCRDRTEWFTPEGRQRMIDGRLGDKHPHAKGLKDTHKEKISATMRGTRGGEFNPMYGRKHKPETIKKIRAKAFERPRRIWVSCPTETLLINEAEALKLVTDKGWQKGRTYDPYRPDYND
tara:strand:+ start:448 stop:996 length:549 start_codon:yes stop_codon:yes gene_type:complete